MENARHTMLLVDDTEINLDILEGIFEADFIILKALNGKQALKVLKSQKVDIVILDVVMPEMDGFGVLEAMKEDPALADIPVIIATADEGENEERALLNGADDFIKKPYNPVAVYKRVENILVKHVLEREKLKDALNNSKMEFQSLADSVPGGISVWKAEDKISVRYYNDGWCELMGCTPERFAEKYAEDLSKVIYPPDRERVMGALLADSKPGRSVHLEHRIVRDDQEVRGVNLSAVHYKTEDGAPIYRAVDIDVTSSKENEILAEQRNVELRHILEHDSLTDVYNRYGFCTRTSSFLKDHPDEKYVIMQLDIERFKVVNELYGIDVGDKVLCTLAECLKKHLEGIGVFGRFEADHFVMCIPDDREFQEHIRTTLQSQMADMGLRHEIDLYFGIYPITDRDMSVELMCDRAQLALESIKGNYNQNYIIYDDIMNQKVLLEQEITNEMEWALEGGQFQVYIQPIYSLKENCLVSAEALVRWFHPEKGMISPGDFIPFFEKNGFIVKLDAYVREKVVELLAAVKKQGKRSVPVSVNLSRLELYDPDFCNKLVGLIENYQVSPEYLRLEITESAYTDNPQQLLDTIGVLRKYGFDILMDDFGSGYSSLNMLKEVPVDILKLDMRFLAGNDVFGREASILASIVHMAHDIGMATVAEGIETEEQASFLKKIACEYGQGYYYSRPIPSEKFLELLDSGTHAEGRRASGSKA